MMIVKCKNLIVALAAAFLLMATASHAYECKNFAIQVDSAASASKANADALKAWSDTAESSFGLEWSIWKMLLTAA